MTPRPVLRISIPEPCSEDWNSMTPTGQHRRHCARCSKQITDFSGMTDGQLLRHFQEQNGRLCGRFSKAQLDRKLYAHSRPTPYWRRAATWLGLLLAGGSIGAQTMPPVEVTECATPPGKAAQTDSEQNDLERSDKQRVSTPAHRPILVTGKVTDEYGAPLIGANIVVTGTVNGTITDIDGTFSLDVPRDATLNISYVGFETQEIKLNKVLPKGNKTTEAVRIPDVRLVDAAQQLEGLVGIIVAEPRRATVFGNLKQWLRELSAKRQAAESRREERRAARRAERPETVNVAPDNFPVLDDSNNFSAASATSLSVFPNPGDGPFKLAYESPTDQKVMVEILTISGQPLYFAPWDVESGPNEMTLERNKFAQQSGSYLIRLVMENGTAETVRVVIQ